MSVLPYPLIYKREDLCHTPLHPPPCQAEVWFQLESSLSCQTHLEAKGQIFNVTLTYWLQTAGHGPVASQTWRSLWTECNAREGGRQQWWASSRKRAQQPQWWKDLGEAPTGSTSVPCPVYTHPFQPLSCSFQSKNQRAYLHADPDTRRGFSQGQSLCHSQGCWGLGSCS